MYPADVEALGLAVLALLLAGPVPLALAHSRWPSRDPRAALVGWQAIGLAGGLAAIGALLSLGVASRRDHLLPGLMSLARHGFGGIPLWRVVAFGLGAVLAVWLLTVLAVSFASVLRDRRRHRQIVDLVGRPGPGLGTLVLDHAVALAYCVPGVRPRVVVTDSALRLLAEDELAAVLAHERAHVRGRHDLVVQPFVAWQSTFPFLRPAAQATRAVALLVEMLADDAASQRTGPDAVAAALARLGASRLPEGALGAGGSTLAVRVRRLLEPAPALRRDAVLLVYFLAVALVVLPTAALLR